MSRRLVIVGISAAAVVGAVVPSFAQSVPVTVQHDTHNGVFVGVGFNGQPGAAALVSPDGSACVGLGEDIPVCTPPVLDGIGTHSQQSLPVTVRHDSNGTAVGAGDIGVIVGNDGSVCPVVSTQDWQCVHP